MFGEIRSLFHDAPTPERWERLCQLVSEWDEPGFDDNVLPYVLDHLESWPDRLRVSPLRWREGLARGARLPFGAMVRVLDARELGLKNEDMWTLARAPIMEHITALDLGGNRIGWRGMMHLFEGSEPVAPRLRALGLDRTAIGSTGVELLGESEALGELGELRLAEVGMSPEALEKLLSGPGSAHLRALDLSDNGMTERYVSALAGAPGFEHLEILALDRNPLGSHGGLRLMRRAQLDRVRVLSVAACELPGPILGAMARAQRPQSLQALRLSHNPGLPSAADLASSRAFGALTRLEVAGARMTREGLEALVTSEALGALETIATEDEARSPALEARAAARGRRLVPAPVTLAEGVLADW